LKKVIVVSGIIFFLLIAAIAAFVLTFNVDRYRPLLCTKLESVLGNPVQLDSVKLGFRGGIALELKGLRLYPGSTQKSRPYFQLKALSARLKLEPLLRREIKVGSVLLDEPVFSLVRQGDGGVEPLDGYKGYSGNISNTSHPKNNSNKPLAVSQAASLSLFVDEIKIRNGIVSFIDYSSKTPAPITMDRIDIDLADVSLMQPIQAKGKAAFYSTEQNVNAEVEIVLKLAEKMVVLRNLNVKSDLKSLSLETLAERFLPVEKMSLRDPVEGVLTIAAKEIQIPFSEKADFNLLGHLADGKIVSNLIQSPFKHVTADFTIDPQQIHLSRFSGDFSRGLVHGEGRFFYSAKEPSVAIDLAAENIDMSTLLPPFPENAPQLKGGLSVSVRGIASLAENATMGQAFDGQGVISLRDGVLTNFNLLKEVFSKLSIIPGVVDTLKSRLTPEYEQKLSARDTVFLPVEWPFTLNQGTFSFKDVRLETDSLELIGSGFFSTNLYLQLTSILFIDPELSLAMIKSVNELQTLTDTTGRLKIPVKIQGQVPRVKVVPDVSSVATALVVTKAQDLIGNFLKKTLEKEGIIQKQAQGTAQS